MGEKYSLGKTLVVDLSSGKTKTKEIDDKTFSGIIGGRGAGIKLLMDISPAKIDPLSPYITG